MIYYFDINGRIKLKYIIEALTFQYILFFIVNNYFEVLSY